jgi:hypothetical protein
MFSFEIFNFVISVPMFLDFFGEDEFDIIEERIVGERGEVNSF